MLSFPAPRLTFWCGRARRGFGLLCDFSGIGPAEASSASMVGWVCYVFVQGAQTFMGMIPRIKVCIDENQGFNKLWLDFIWIRR